MYHFRKLWLSIFLVLTGVLYVTSQNQVTVMVNILPPYTPYISDYIEDTGKVIVTLNYTSATGAPLDVYLHGSFTGTSTGINVYTDPNYIPPMPIHLENGQTYQLSPDEIGDLYAMENVIYEGITAEDMMTSGALPEDYYQLCVRAYKYDTIDPVSQSAPSGCSPQFLISNIDPPIIMTPMCGEEILMQNPQNIYVNWTPPVGANPMFITYYFRMVEVPFDSGIDPIDALTETSYASIYEEEVFNGTSLLLTNNKVQLSPNNTYAFSVQALSDTGDYFFKNNGVSEACWFTYNEEETGDFVHIDDNVSMLDDFIDQYELIPETKVSGTLYYKVPVSEQTPMSHEMPNPLTNNQTTASYAPPTINYAAVNNAVIGYSGNANTNYYGIPNNTGIISQLQHAPPNGPGLLHKETETIDRNKPLANTKVRLVVRLGEKVDGYEFPSFSSASVMSLSENDDNAITDLEGNLVRDFSGIGMVLDVTETDDNGNFSFDFRNKFINGTCLAYHHQADGIDLTVPADPAARFRIDRLTGRPIVDPVNVSPIEIFSGFLENPYGNSEEMRPMSHVNYRSEVVDAYICLKVEVVNQKFCSPDVDIFALPGDVVDVGDQVALLKTYNAYISVISDNTDPQLLGKGEGIPNTKVKILRDIRELSLEHPIVLKEEGQHLDSKTYTNDGEFKDVSKGETSLAEPQGKLLVKGLVKHWDSNTAGQLFSGTAIYQSTNQYESLYSFNQSDSPYWVSVATRDAKNEDAEYENTFYNYNGKFVPVETTPFNTVNKSFQYGVGDRPVTYNNIYEVLTLPFEYILEPEEPEIKGRVMTDTNLEYVGLEGAEIKLMYVDSPVDKYDLGHIEKEFVTLKDGFFRFPDIGIEGGRRLIIIKEGYATQIIPPTGQLPYTLNNGELMNLNDIRMIPSKYLKGRVVDEEGTPVVAHIRILEDGPYYKTESFTNVYNPENNAQNFDIAAAYTGNKIEIDPLLTNYFLKEFEDIAITEERQTFTVYEKLHRLSLQVTGDQGKPVIFAKVVVGDDLADGLADSHGIFKAKFASAGKQFVLKVSAPNFAPYQSILDLEVSEDWTYKDIQLTPSFSISGYISDAESEEKIPNAHVFAELNNTDGHQLYIEATTDNEGHYILKGIPREYTTLEMHIEKGGNNPSYIGKVAEITVSSLPLANKVFNFELSPIEGWDLSQILGFPMQVDHFKTAKTNNNRAFIDGYLHHMPTTAGFATQEADSKVFFKDLFIERGVNGKVVPVGDEITLDNIQIPVKLNNIFTAMLKKPVYNDGVPGAAKRLKLEKLNDNQGQIKSGVKIDLQFHHTSISLDGDFYLGDNTNSYATTVFKSNLGNSIQNARRPVFDIGFDFKNAFQPFPKAIKDYTVFEFRADSDIDESYLDGDRISIKTILHTAIPMGSSPDLDLKMPIGSVVITQNNISIEKAATEDFSFMLEKWEVFVKEDWEFDKNEDAIVLPEVLVNSAKGFSATLTDLKVRPTELREGDVSLSGGLSLGGVAPLVLASGLEPIFNYDAGAGAGHYRISLIGETNEDYVAFVDSKYLEGTSDDIQFKSVGLLSNDVEVLNLNQGMRFYDIMNVQVNQIMTGNGAFSLKGSPNFNRVNNNGEIPETGIPGFVSESNVIIDYGKDGSSTKLKPTIRPLQGYVDCNHNVVFNIDDDKPETQIFSEGKFTMEGDLKVSPSANDIGGEEDSFYLNGRLTKVSDDAAIEVMESKFYLETKELNILNGGIAANIPQNTWNLLSFKATPDPTGLGGLKPETIFNFTVLGNVSVGSDNIQVDEMDFGFGAMELVFNFKEPSLYGVLHYKGEHISLGYAAVKPYTLALLIDPNGLYIGSTANIRILSYPLLHCDGAILVGYTTTNLNSKIGPLLKDYRINKPNFDTGLKGFYILGQRSYEKGIDIKIADASVEIAVGAYVYCNFAGNTTIKLGGYGYAYGGGSIDVLVCDFSTHLGNQILIDATYENGGFSFCNSCNLDFDFTIDCPDPFDFSVNKSFTLKISNNGLSWGGEQCD